MQHYSIGIKNSFGLPIHSIREIIADQEIAPVLHEMGHNVFRYLGFSPEESDEAMGECLQLACYPKEIDEYELAAHTLLEQHGITGAIPVKLSERAYTIRDQVEPSLIPGSLLDLGCGDGRVGMLLAGDGYNVRLADVYRNPNIDISALPFQMLDQSGHVPFPDNLFDNTILITVLHHCNNPVLVFREAQRVTRKNGRVVVVESVYGVTGEALSPAQRELCPGYFALNPEKQRCVNIFFDHFYNRVVHYSADPVNKVNVPFNFNTPESWKHLFELEGMKQEKIIHLGLDQPVVPEYHTLHELRVLK
jgi:SAM-dependent methyltransferase